MEVHRLLGRGFLEIVYKDAIDMACSKCKLGIIVNFGEDLLKYKRLIL